MGFRITKELYSQIKGEFGIHRSMMQRCGNPNCYSYKYYGGMGVKVCDRWLGKLGFMHFLSDMGIRPSDNHSLDRINPFGDYEPSNCRWATSKEQAKNRRNVLYRRMHSRYGVHPLSCVEAVRDSLTFFF